MRQRRDRQAAARAERPQDGALGRHRDPRRLMIADRQRVAHCGVPGAALEHDRALPRRGQHSVGRQQLGRSLGAAQAN